MNDKTSSQESAGTEIEFYVPATFQFSTEPGAVERVIVGVFGDRSSLEARITAEEPTTEFYMPAVYQFSTEPGRIEQFLETVFKHRNDEGFRSVPDRFVDLFYLPAVDPDEFRRRDDRKRPPLAPATEIIQERLTD